MADWKIPVSYNYSPSYHTYAYGLMYQQGPEQTHANVSWTEAAYGSATGVTGSYYSAPQTASSQTPPGSPEYSTTTDGHYPSSVVYYADSQTHTQNGRLFLSHNRVQYEQQTKEQERAGSDTPSDSEAHTPDSWSSGSSREGNATQVDLELIDWVKKERAYKDDGDSPAGSEAASRSLSESSEDQSNVKVDGAGGPPRVPTVVPSPPKHVPVSQTRKAKTRTAFSEGQMSALNDRFNVQRYLTPAEMKTLAGLTGLTYKQVKTWFQNRRMKLKRHQKDNSWVSERYVAAGIPRVSNPHAQFQVDPQILHQEFYTNPQFRDSIFKKSPPQTTFYSNYTRPLSPSQVSPRPQGSWPLPPTVMHYELPNPSSFVPVNGNAGISSDCVSTVEVEGSPTQVTSVVFLSNL